MEESAKELEYPFERLKAENEIKRQLGSGITVPAVVRIILSRTGDITFEALPMAKIDDKPRTAVISRLKTDAADRLLRHKTTARKLYDTELAAARRSGCVEVLFVNTEGYLTEGSFTNLFIKTDSAWFTPGIRCGLLPGIWRRHFLALCDAEEKDIELSELAEARRVVLGNSVRGEIEIDQVIDPDGSVLFQKRP
jgi:para-aminobenzoate synthetase/4-amino-4-deoxychorismate lyase